MRTKSDDTDSEENQTRDQNASICGLFELAHFALAIIRIHLLLFSAARDDPCQHEVADDKADTDQRTLAADKYHPRKHGDQNAGDKEAVGQHHDIVCKAIGKESLDPEYDKRKCRGNAKADQKLDK